MHDADVSGVYSFIYYENDEEYDGHIMAMCIFILIQSMECPLVPMILIMTSSYDDARS